MNGKQILITGATNGIGLAAAEALVALGANVAIVGRNETGTAHCGGAGQGGQEAGSDGRHIHRRPLVAGSGAQAGRRGAGPLSETGCAHQQRRRHVREAAGDRGRHRADLGGQPPRALPADHAAARPPEGERAGTHRHHGVGGASGRAHTLRRPECRALVQGLRALRPDQARQHPVHQRIGAPPRGHRRDGKLLPSRAGGDGVQPQQRPADGPRHDDPQAGLAQPGEGGGDPRVAGDLAGSRNCEWRILLRQEARDCRAPRRRTWRRRGGYGRSARRSARALRARAETR